MSSSLIVKTAPVSEPISLADMKAHLRVTIPDEDALIQNYIRAGRWNLENTYRLACLTQTLDLGMDYFGQPEWDVWSPVLPMGLWGIGQAWAGFPRASPIELRPPVQSVTSITYLDTTGATQTMPGANYVIDTSSAPGRVAPALGKLWPVTGWTPQAVTIEFVTGYTSSSLVPDPILQALRLIVSTWYLNREQSVIGTRLVAVSLPDGVDQLMAPYKKLLVR